ELPSPKFTKVYEEGQTKVYENTKAFPRAFFVKEIQSVNNKQEAINSLFADTIDLHTIAVVEKWDDHLETGSNLTVGTVQIAGYKENMVVVETENPRVGFLVLTDTCYPTWHAKVCLPD